MQKKLVCYVSSTTRVHRDEFSVFLAQQQLPSLDPLYFYSFMSTIVRVCHKNKLKSHLAHYVHIFI